MSSDLDTIKRKEVEAKLALAKEYLAIAEKLSDEESMIRGVVDTGYNSVELCAKGLILLKEDTLPTRHSGVVQKFSELYIKTGNLPVEIIEKMQKALRFRNFARYEAETPISKSWGQEITALAKEMIAALEKIIQK